MVEPFVHSEICYRKLKRSAVVRGDNPEVAFLITRAFSYSNAIIFEPI